MTIPKFIENEPNLKEALSEVTQGYSSFVIITDTNVAECVLPLVIANCEALSRAEVIEIEPGEESKELAMAAQVFESLLEIGADRKSLIIALGGGVVTDFGSFVASTYKRGVDFVLMPTSLLAMVDAALGGKTAVDVGVTKNAVGTFAHAKHTLVYFPFLASLPEEELNSGFAEMLKHAVIADKSLFHELVEVDSFDAEELIPFIQQASSIKMEIVLQDPYEHDKRKLLNFGHTVGHAVESVCLKKNKPVSHGVAVALGMLVEAEIALHEFQLQKEDFAELKRCLITNFDFTFAATIDFEEMVAFLLNDKKNIGKDVFVVKLAKLGTAELPVPVALESISSAWYRTLRIIS